MVAAARLEVVIDGFTALTVSRRDFATVPALLTALTVTVKVPDFVGVPLTRLVEDVKDSPLGSPVTVTVGVGLPVTVSVAL